MKRVGLGIGLVVGVALVALITTLVVRKDNGVDDRVVTTGKLHIEGKVTGASRTYHETFSVTEVCSLGKGLDLPDWLCGRSTRVEVTGSVPFESHLKSATVTKTPTGSVVVHLPPPQPGKISIDHLKRLTEDTGVLSDVRDLLKGRPDLLEQVIDEANSTLRGSAQKDDEAVSASEKEIRRQVRRLLGEVGVSAVTVEFDQAPAPDASQ